MTLIVLAFLLQAAQAPAGVVAGRVVDQKGAPLAGVSVSLGGQPLKAPQTVKTGADGTYRFPGVPSGNYTLSFRLNGVVAPVNQDNVVVTAEEGRLVVGGSRAPDVVMIRGVAGYHPPHSPSLDGIVTVRIQTALGDIDIIVETKRAPITSANFLKYVDAGLYDGGRFNRVTRPDNYNTAPPNRPMMEIIQGGLSPDKRAQAFAPIALERTSVTGLTHVRGVVSMARGGPDTATSEFFILIDDQPSLDFGGKRFDDNQGAAAFGAVISGLDVIARIQQQPVEGQNLTPPVGIISIKRVK